MRVSELDFDFDGLLNDAEDAARRDWDVDFVSDMRNRYDEWEDEMFISERQIEQLERIAEQ